MVISYHGGECIKITHGDKTLAFNPISKSSKLKAVSFGADIVFVSLNHADSNGVEQVTRVEKKPFVIQGPGEYEVADVFVKGLQSVSRYGGEDRINTIYLVGLEGLNICFLGALGDAKLSSEVLAEIDTVDILFVPVGGDGVLQAGEAHDIAVKLEARIVIPIHFDTIGEKDALKKFLKEEGTDAKPVEKLTVKKRDVEGKEGEVVVLKS